jgi:hypothetical protein
LSQGNVPVCEASGYYMSVSRIGHEEKAPEKNPALNIMALAADL